MDYIESLDYLYGLQRFGIKLGLQNMQDLLERLPVLQKPFPCIHIAGTNGKGSVSVMLAEILRHSGLQVGLYTSPHLHCFTERIRIDGVPITPENAASLAETVRRAAGDLPITFFEATTAMALLAFQERQLDIAVVETGLGGRLDATNIVEPILSMITPVSYDHTEHLGDSLTQIAAEKAGIIKPDVPVVVGRQKPAAEVVIKATAAELNAKVFMAGIDYDWQGHQTNFSIDVTGRHLDGLSCALAGTHQLDNFAQAVAAAIQLRDQGIVITDNAIRAAGRSVYWPGRLEWWDKSCRILTDVSHNRAGISCLATYLEEQQVAAVNLVVGLSGERDPAEALMPLVKFSSAVYAVPVSYGSAVPPDLVAGWANQQGLPAGTYNSAEEGLVAALDHAGGKRPVVICGSIYLVAELRQKYLEGKFSAYIDAVDFQ